MRKRVYRDHRKNNWMGWINTFLAGFFVAGALCFAGFMVLVAKSGIYSLFFILWARWRSFVAGVIGGIVLTVIPPVRRGFRENPFLYYLPSVFMGVIAGFFLFLIWFY